MKGAPSPPNAVYPYRMGAPGMTSSGEPPNLQEKHVAVLSPNVGHNQRRKYAASQNLPAPPRYKELLPPHDIGRRLYGTPILIQTEAGKSIFINKLTFLLLSFFFLLPLVARARQPR